MVQRGIKRENVKEVITKGEMIESYENDKPFPSALFFKIVNGEPLHVVISFDERQNKVYIITAYKPSIEIFESDYKTRKRK